MGDPVTGPLGVIIGVPQLVFTCVQYYDAFVSYANQKNDFGSYCILFEVEHHTFKSWKSRAMPDGQTILIQDSAIENLTIACLDQIKIAFQDAEKFSKSYGLRQLLDWSTRKAELKKEIQDVSPVRKVAWALEGEKSAAALWQKLRSYNEALASLWRMTRDSIERQLLPELDNFNNVGGLRVMESALKRENDPEYQNLAAAIRLRRVCLETKNTSKDEMDHLTVGKASKRMAELELESGDFENNFFAQMPTRLTTKAKGHDALVEWKYYEYNRKYGLERKMYEKVIRTSIRELVLILAEPSKPRRLRALECVGFYEFEDDEPFSKACFAFKVPEGANPEPLTLQQLIEEGKTHPEYFLYLGDRFTLAQGLTSALYQLLYLGWLHKGIRSENIHFYRAVEPTSWRPDPKEFFLMGYEFARPISSKSLSLSPEDTEDSARYRHPKYLDSTVVDYEPKFDLYSMGIVLIEIALWKTARTLAKDWNTDKEGRKCISIDDWQCVVGKYLVGEVEKKVGRVYAEVVRRCIEGDLDINMEEMNLLEMVKCFDKLVVANLEMCFA